MRYEIDNKDQSNNSLHQKPTIPDFSNIKILSPFKVRVKNFLNIVIQSLWVDFNVDIQETRYRSESKSSKWKLQRTKKVNKEVLWNTNLQNIPGKLRENENEKRKREKERKTNKTGLYRNYRKSAFSPRVKVRK